MIDLDAIQEASEWDNINIDDAYRLRKLLDNYLVEQERQDEL